MTLFGRDKSGINSVRLGSTVFNVRPGRRMLFRTVIVRETSLHRKARGAGVHSRITNKKHGP